MPARYHQLFARAAVGLSVLGAPAVVRAAAAQIDLQLDCWPLDADPEQRAAFEARSIAALSLSNMGSGALRVYCDDERAIVIWQPKGHAPLTRQSSVSEDPATQVDSLMAVVWELATAAVLDPLPPQPQPQPSARPAPVGTLGVGLSAELWRVGIPGWVGPRLVLPLHISSRLTVSPQAEARWALGTLMVADNHSANLWSVAAGAALDAHVGPAVPLLEVGVGTLWSYVQFVGSDRLVPERRRTWGAAVLGRVRARLPWGRYALLLGPELRVNLARPALRLDGLEVFAVPTVAIGGALECRF